MQIDRHDGAAGRSESLLGFDENTGRWSKDDSSPSWVRVPEIVGQLTISEAARDRASRDQGNIVTVRPDVVLRPAVAEDIAAMVRFCRRFGISVAPAGSRHSSFGQSLVAGLAIDMTSMKHVGEFTANRCWVEGGTRWQQVLEAGLRNDLRLSTGYTSILHLTVGGVLSLGGITTYRTGGAILDAVQELEVVTGAGDVVHCSPSENGELFDAVLGGLGQFGIITRAQLDFVPVLPFVRVYTLVYPHADIRDALADQRVLSDREGIDELLIRWGQQSDGPPVAESGIGVYYSSSQPPDDEYLFRGLSRRPERVVDMTYRERSESVDKRYATYDAQGWSQTIKVWSDNFLPDRSATQRNGDVLPMELSMEDVLISILEELTERDWSPTSPVLLFRKHRRAFVRTGLRLPAVELGDHVCLFDISSDSFGKAEDPTYVDDLKARNRRWLLRARRAGARPYPLGATELFSEDWKFHYADDYERLRSLKGRFDPDAILTPGPQIFD